MKVKVHRVVLMIVDHHELGDDGIQEEIEAVRFPNGCMRPEVMQIDTREVEWFDGCDLNKRDLSRDRAFDALFRGVR